MTISRNNSNKKYLENDRTLFGLSDNGVDHSRFIFGFVIFFLIFVILIPILLIKNQYFAVLTAYMPNLDILATILGYHGGPMNTFIWRYLYNPAAATYSGYISSNIINYISLLGVTYVIAFYTDKTKNIYKGWSRAIIMLLLTYFLPNNIIVYLMNKIGVYLNRFLNSDTLLHYILLIISGLIMVSVIIITEANLIEHTVPHIAKTLEKIVSF